MIKKYGPPEQTVEDKRQTTDKWRARKEEAGYKLIQVYLSAETFKLINSFNNRLGLNKNKARLVDLALRALENSVNEGKN